MHYLSTGIRAHRETHPFAITGFIIIIIIISDLYSTPHEGFVVLFRCASQ